LRKVQESITKIFKDFKSLNNLDLNSERHEVIEVLNLLEKDISKTKEMINNQEGDFKQYLECMACGHKSVPIKSDCFVLQMSKCEDCNIEFSVRMFKSGRFRMRNMGVKNERSS